MNKKLCKGYEEYVAQDSHLPKFSQFEIPFSCLGFDSIILPDKLETKVFMSGGDMSKWDLIVKMYFFDRQEISEIKRQVGCSEQYVYIVIAKCKKVLLNRELVKNVIRLSRKGGVNCGM
jgi:hypothetical protein